MESNAWNTDIVPSIPAPCVPTKNKGGAPPSFIWKFFSKLEQSNKKTNRYRAQCSFCQHVIEDGRVENLHKHILHVCQIVSQEIRQYVEAELDKKALEQGNSSKKVAKRASGQTPRAALVLASRPITEDEQDELDIKLFRLLIMKSLPFTAVDSPWLLDFCHSLNPAHVPAGNLHCCQSGTHVLGTL